VDGGGPALSGRRVVLCVGGGIAAYKAAVLARLLVADGADVHVLMTASGARFVGPDTFAALTRNPVPRDVFEQSEHVLHVRLAHQADVAVVAPATADLLARMALGLADDLVTSTLLEATCPLVVAPAMHSGMWRHPATERNVETLRGRGAVLVGPEDGPLAAGDEGIGRMAEPDRIAAAVAEAVAGTGPSASTRELAGRRMLVTAGPTHEPIDAVRYIGNRSSGSMGYRIAAEAARRGAWVELVSGPVSLPDPAGVRVQRVETAEEMLHATLERFDGVDVVVMAAAVADFRSASTASGKLKKSAGPPEVTLVPNPDILAALAEKRDGQLLVGFAADTADVPGGLLAEGRRKLEAKGADLLVVNEVGRPGTGFGSETNRAAILSRDGDDPALAEWTKAGLAAALCDRITVELRERSVGGAR
jgi:phosphopantothenoylcysteine decarboxylase/phosphopantothenate--cysteine ligase